MFIYRASWIVPKVLKVAKKCVETRGVSRLASVAGMLLAEMYEVWLQYIFCGTLHNPCLVGGFKCFRFSPLLEERIQFD